MEEYNSENKGYYSNDSNLNNRNNPNKNRKESSLIFGIVIVIAGVFMLIKSTPIGNIWLIDELFSFPTILIILGMYLGYKKQYKFGFWAFLVGIGVISLLDNLGLNFGGFIFPLGLIAFGIYILQKNKKNKQFPMLPEGPKEELKSEFSTESTINFHESSSDFQQKSTSSFQEESFEFKQDFGRPEFVNIDSIFAGNNRVVTSNNFMGGKLGTVFGGMNLDCRTANIQQDIVIDIYVVFGGLELIFPANWQVINETTTIFGSLEDKRRLINNTGTERRVILTGFTLFGSVEIKNI